ncbi:MAG: hypothetical protein J6D54_00400, partial [Olsenella sp.]|nr:hypothetical protein [Olsenella sp.]
LRSVATAKRAAEAVGSRGGTIDPTLVAVARELAELEARTRAVEDGARAAEEALSLAGRLERVRAELRALPAGGWDPGTRARRADLVRESARLEGEVEARLAGSQGHLAARGLLAAPPSVRARSVAERYREIAERLRIEVEDASGTLADVAATRAEMESRGLRVPSAFAPPAPAARKQSGRDHPSYVRTRDDYAPKKAEARSKGETQDRRQETDHTQTQAKMTKRHPWPKR